jgi:hypothetical protein
MPCVSIEYHADYSADRWSSFSHSQVISVVISVAHRGGTGLFVFFFRMVYLFIDLYSYSCLSFVVTCFFFQYILFENTIFVVVAVTRCGDASVNNYSSYGRWHATASVL